jgi:hypothetical protein
MSAATKLSEELAAHDSETKTFQTEMRAFVEEQKKHNAALSAEVAKLQEQLQEALVKAATKSAKAAPKKKEEMTIPDKQLDIKTWFISHYVSHSEDINKLLSEESMSKVMSYVAKKPQAKTGGTQLNKIKATAIYDLIFQSNKEFAETITAKFEEENPKTETQAP